MNKHKGFTIIEVALVLAIAGVIFLMVFIALPALWASERDTERRNDVINFVQQLKNFTGNNNRGALPKFTNSANNEKFNDRVAVLIEGATITPSQKMNGTTWEDFLAGYFNESYDDPDGEKYNFYIMTCMDSEAGEKNLDAPCDRKELRELADNPFPNNYQMYIVVGGVCNGEESVKLSANKRKVAALYKLEGGGVYCQNT